MKLEIEITRKDYVELNRSHFFKSATIKRIMILFGILAVIQIAFKIKSGEGIFTVILPIIIMGLIFCGVLYFSISRTGRLPKEGGSILGRKTIELTSDDLKFTSTDSSSVVRWVKSMKLVDSKNAVYIYLDTNMAIIIPKRYFHSKQQEKETISFIEARINAA